MFCQLCHLTMEHLSFLTTKWYIYFQKNHLLFELSGYKLRNFFWTFHMFLHILYPERSSNMMTNCENLYTQTICTFCITAPRSSQALLVKGKLLFLRMAIAYVVHNVQGSLKIVFELISVVAPHVNPLEYF